MTKIKVYYKIVCNLYSIKITISLLKIQSNKSQHLVIGYMCVVVD